jgi:hypothetical protein
MADDVFRQQSEQPSKVIWGIGLCGHQFDLEYWRDTLKEPFDPSVTQQANIYILRSSEFASCDTAPAAWEKAKPLIEILNGAMRADTGSHPLRCCGVYELRSDGWRQTEHKFPPSPITDLRAKLNLEPRLAPFPPNPSRPQTWIELSDRSDHLTDALIYFGRGEWFDIYKAIECLEAFADDQLKAKKWAKPDDITLMKWTANSLYRHRHGGFTPPPKPMTLEQATELLATLIGCAFNELRSAVSAKS